jgi:hypothetical protein
VRQNWQDKPCKQAAPIVDKKWLAHWNDAFAHLVLWISFGLSTAGDPFFSQNEVSEFQQGWQDPLGQWQRWSAEKICEQVTDDFQPSLRQSLAQRFFFQLSKIFFENRRNGLHTRYVYKDSSSC